jgi:hypothetical protein
MEKLKRGIQGEEQKETNSQNEELLKGANVKKPQGLSR